MKTRATEQFVTSADGTRWGVLLDLKTYERLLLQVLVVVIGHRRDVYR